jgi:hypothetical protein
VTHAKRAPGSPPADNISTPAGRVRHDKSGRAIWEWAVDTGRHALDSTSRLLKRLDIPGLALEEEIKRKKIAEQEPEPGPAAVNPVPTFGGPRETDPMAGRRGGFNPYDSRMPPPRKAVQPSTSRPTLRTPPRSTAVAKPGLLSRLFGSGK